MMYRPNESQQEEYPVQINPVDAEQPQPQPAQQPPRPRRRGVKLVAAALAVALVAGAAGGVAGYTAGSRSTADDGAAATLSTAEPAGDTAQANGNGSSTTVTTPTTATTLVNDDLDLAPARKDLLTPAEVYEQNVNAVAAISTEGVTTNNWGQLSRFASSGSGFVITSDGYVVTNHHVIDDATTIKVILTSGETYEAELVGSDEENDVALLKIDATGLQVVSLGDSDNLQVGDQVAAIGNPRGELTNTLTVGYVSALEREISTSDGTPINMLQTDAAITR